MGIYKNTQQTGYLVILTFLKLTFAQSAVLLCPITQYRNETCFNVLDKLQQKSRNQLELKMEGMASVVYAISLSIQKNGEEAVFARSINGFDSWPVPILSFLVLSDWNRKDEPWWGLPFLCVFPVKVKPSISSPCIFFNLRVLTSRWKDIVWNLRTCFKRTGGW